MHQKKGFSVVNWGKEKGESFLLERKRFAGSMKRQ